MITAEDYIPKNRADALAYYEWACIHLEGEDRIKPKDRQRRKPSITTLIKRARKAGERGPVTITLPDGIVITSTSEIAALHIDDASEWN
jgi:hypothetical protein